MRQRLRSQAGFTFVEILITLVFLSIALLAVTIQFPVGLAIGESAEDLTVTTNLAQEMLEEIRFLPWRDPDSPTNPIGPDPGETIRNLHFDDVDDYEGLVEYPPRDLNGNAMDGTSGLPSFGKYRRSVSVTYIDSSTMTATVTTTWIKRVDVTVENVNTGQQANLYLFLTRTP